MTPLDAQLTDMARGILRGEGVGEPLAAALRNVHNQGCPLNFCLESSHGPLLDTAQPATPAAMSGWKHSAQPALAPLADNNRKFLFSVSPELWEVLSSFTIEHECFYTTLSLSSPGGVDRTVRSGFLELSAMLNNRLHRQLMAFLHGPAAKEPAAEEQPHQREREVLRRLVGFSAQIDCIVLLDSDGFILDAVGHTGQVERIAASLALFHHRSVRELGRMGQITVGSATCAGADATALIGQIPGSRIALALSVHGANAKCLAPFLFAAGQAGLRRIAAGCGRLWGALLEPEQAPLRIRDSWFTPAQLIAQGKFVCRQEGRTFHVPSCKSLSSADAHRLAWYERRADALRAGRSPCKTCNP